MLCIHGTRTGSSGVERGLLCVTQTGLDLRQEFVGGLGRRGGTAAIEEAIGCHQYSVS